jgi:hypothetical protein
MRLTKKNLLLWFCLNLAAVSAFASTIDFTSLPSEGMLEWNISGSEVIPSDRLGILEEFDVTLPPFSAGTYFAGGKSGNNRWPNYVNWGVPYMIGSNFSQSYKSSPGFALSLLLNDGRYLVIVPIFGHTAGTWLDVDQEQSSLKMIVGSMGTNVVANTEPMVAWAFASDPYTAWHTAWKQALDHPSIRGEESDIPRTTWRQNKPYPEVFHYLGYSTWEHYRRDINSTVLVEMAEQIKESRLPIRWIQVDAGHWDSVDQADLLLSWDPSPDADKFPTNGWSDFMAQTDENTIKWTGIWWSQGGAPGEHISPEGPIADHLGDFLEESSPGKLRTKPEKAAHKAFYERMLSKTAAHGFDFIKIDGGTEMLSIYQGCYNGVETAKDRMLALEEATQRHMGGVKLNSMSHNPNITFNTRYSCVTRSSGDFKNRAPAVCNRTHHSFHNTLWLGHTVWPDPDMFHAGNPAGELLAMCRALAGGPSYLSDEAICFAPGNPTPEDIESVVFPLVFKNGKLLRPLAPGVPLPDSMFIDALSSPAALRVVAPLEHGCAAIGLFNLSGRDAITSCVTSNDYIYAGGMIQPYAGLWELPPEGVVAFDWKKQTAYDLAQSPPISLKKQKANLIILSPVQHGWAVVGRTDKYLAPAGVQTANASKEQLELLLKESGPITVYHASKEPSA